MDAIENYRFHKNQLEKEVSRKADLLEKIDLIKQRIEDSLSCEEKEVLKEWLDDSIFLLERVEYLIDKHTQVMNGNTDNVF